VMDLIVVADDVWRIDAGTEGDLSNGCTEHHPCALQVR